jgi:hypothetical protein
MRHKTAWRLAALIVEKNVFAIGTLQGGMSPRRASEGGPQGKAWRASCV